MVAMTTAEFEWDSLSSSTFMMSYTSCSSLGRYWEATSRTWHCAHSEKSYSSRNILLTTYVLLDQVQIALMRISSAAEVHLKFI